MGNIFHLIKRSRATFYNKLVAQMRGSRNSGGWPEAEAQCSLSLHPSKVYQHSGRDGNSN